MLLKGRETKLSQAVMGTYLLVAGFEVETGDVHATVKELDDLLGFPAEGG